MIKIRERRHFRDTGGYKFVYKCKHCETLQVYTSIPIPACLTCGRFQPNIAMLEHLVHRVIYHQRGTILNAKA